MAGRIRKPGAASGLVPTEPPAVDLTAERGLTHLSGQRVVDIGRRTMDAAERLIGTWEDAEPLIKLLLAKVKTFAENPDVQDVKAAALLRDAATVSQRVANAATAVLRASEGQVRLAVLLEGPRPQRAQPGQMTEKQLVGAVLETVRKIKAEQGACPVCTTTVTTNGTAPHAEG